MVTFPLTVKVARRVAGVTREAARRTEADYQRRVRAQMGVGRAHQIATWTTPEELDTLYRLAVDCPDGATALEVGSYLGASACYIAAGLAQKQGHLFCIDTWNNETMPEGEQDTLPEFQRNTCGLSGTITTIRSRSDELTQDEIPKSLSLVFLDGDHSYAATRADFDLFSPSVSDTGVLAFHDSLFFQGVSKVIGEALVSGEWMIAGNVNNLLWLKRAHWEK